MSEQLFDGLPPLPPERPMTEDDWARLEARIDSAIATHERTRRRRLVLAMAAALLVLLVAVGATWYQSTRPSPGSSDHFEVLCATDATAAAGGAVLPSDGTDPRSQCEGEWRNGAVVVGATAPPAPLVACQRVLNRTPTVWVFPDDGAGTCARLGFDELDDDYGASNERFAALRERIGPIAPEDGCEPYGEVRERAQAALVDLGFDGWEVARPPDGSVADDGTCVDSWVADLQRKLVVLYGPAPTGETG